MEIRRFGIGHRRPEGPPGTRGVEGTPLHGDERGVVSELALKPQAVLAAHTNPNLAYVLVIEGGGFVQVGDERARVAAGDAVVLPPGVIRSVWTELTPMRAVLVEFAPTAGASVEPGLRLLEGRVPEPEGADSAEPATGAAPAEGEVDPGTRPARAEGALRPAPTMPEDRVSPEQEPW